MAATVHVYPATANTAISRNAPLRETTKTDHNASSPKTQIKKLELDLVTTREWRPSKKLLT